ncbi:hypothetical protein [Nostoc sp.]
MDSNVGKSRNRSSSHGRVRGVILSPQGWQQFQAAKQQGHPWDGSVSQRTSARSLSDSPLRTPTG